MLLTGESTATHLAQELFEAAFRQGQTADDVFMCCIEFLKDEGVVVRRDAILWTVKGV